MGRWDRSHHDRVRAAPKGVTVADSERDLVGYGRRGLDVTWPEGARVAVCLVINYEEGAEYSFAAGDGVNEGPQEFDYPPLPVRDFGNESLFEYGSRAGIWRLQRLLDALALPATFQGCAQAFELAPEVGAWIKEAGHDVCCHGYRWENVSTLDRATEADRLQMAIESIEQTCGERPRGWYSRQPASVNTRELLVREGGFLYDSDSFADDLPYFVTVSDRQHLVIPYSFTLNDGRFMPGQSYSDPSSFLDHCKRHLDFLWEEGETQPKLMSIGLHPRFIGQPSRMHALREFLEYALGKERVWFARRIDIARWWLEHHEAFQPPRTARP
jgi:peptidoglycan/xylan/chitin deacetylase (PgdA/CDA1 family)